MHPQRAVAAARWLADHPADSVETAVLAVRNREPDPIPGEREDAGYLGDLQLFWARRSIDRTTPWYTQADRQNLLPSKAAWPGME